MIIPMRSSTPRLIAAGAAERMYYRLEIHFTPAGNRVGSEVAVPILEAQLNAQAAAEGQLKDVRIPLGPDAGHIRTEKPGDWESPAHLA